MKGWFVFLSVFNYTPIFLTSCAVTSLKSDVKVETKKRVKSSLIRDQNDETDKQINDSKMQWPLNNRVERKTERMTLMTQQEI